MHDKAPFHLIPLFSTTVKFNAVSIALHARTKWQQKFRMISLSLQYKYIIKDFRIIDDNSQCRKKASASCYEQNYYYTHRVL